MRPGDEVPRRRRRDEDAMNRSSQYDDVYADEYDDGEYADYTDDGDYAEDEYEDEPPVRRVARRPRPQQRVRQAPQRQRAYPPRTTPRTQRGATSTRTLRPQRRRSVWPVLLGGCALGIFVAVVGAAAIVFFTVRTAQTGSVPIIGGGLSGSTQTFTSASTQTLTLSSLTQLQVCNKVGDVSIAVDPTADSASITTTKVVHQSSKANANTEFGRINVSVLQPATTLASLACASSTSSPTSTTPTATGSTPTATGSTLLVNTAIPDSEGLIHGSGDAVNIKITLTQKLFASASSPLQLNIQAALGNITVDAVSGIFHIIGNIGNVSVTKATLISGSSIGTDQGNVTFNGIIAAPSDATTQASFVLNCGKGTIDATLSGSPNVILSTYTNGGTIHSDFPINVTSSNGSANYRGPLNAAATTQSSAVLTIDVSAGDIYIRKGQV